MMLVPILASVDSSALHGLDDSEDGIQKAFEIVDRARLKIDIDKYWEPLLGMLTNFPPFGSLALYGNHNVSPDPPVSYSTDHEVKDISGALSELDPDAQDDVLVGESFEELREFYSSAAEHDEYVIIVWN
jgi:hypothetical protein